MSFGYCGHPAWLREEPGLGRGDGHGNGYALIPPPFGRGPSLTVLFSDGEGWEHVSVSTPERCPTWAEMCYVKRLFWGADDVVIQYHPAKRDYVNRHPYCLHLWRPVGVALPTPPREFVG